MYALLQQSLRNEQLSLLRSTSLYTNKTTNSEKTFFRFAQLAALVGPVILFAAILPRYIFYGTNRYEAASSKFYWSLLSPTAFTFGADFIADYEYAGVGASWSNYHEGTFSLASCLGMLIFDFFLYGILAWYFDKVLPRYIDTF